MELPLQSDPGDGETPAPSTAPTALRIDKREAGGLPPPLVPGSAASSILETLICSLGATVTPSIFETVNRSRLLRIFCAETITVRV